VSLKDALLLNIIQLIEIISRMVVMLLLSERCGVVKCCRVCKAANLFLRVSSNGMSEVTDDTIFISVDVLV
jgi:hypothetical protein